MEQHLAVILRRMNRMDEEDIGALRRDFRRSLQNNYNVFGKHAFRKRLPEPWRRSVINASLWDVMSTGLSRYGRQHVGKERAKLKTAFGHLLDNEEFYASITLATNSDRKVRTRFEMTQTMLREVLGDHSA